MGLQVGSVVPSFVSFSVRQEKLGYAPQTGVGFGLERAKDLAVQKRQSEGMRCPVVSQLELFRERKVAGITSDLKVF